MASGPLQGKVALVTGAAKRIGRSIAARLASLGAQVIVNYRQSQSAAEQVVREIEAAGGRAVAMQADVTQKAQVEQMFSAVEKKFPGLDILVNNAGEFFLARLGDLTEAQWDRIMDANLKSQFLCSQAAAPLLQRNSGSHIVNISSIGGLIPWPAHTHYCVSKAGSIMLTRCLARALAPKVAVNSVAPGTIQFPGEAPDEAYIQRAPLHRVGKGDDIAEAVAYLVQSQFITGQVLVVDGGRTLV